MSEESVFQPTINPTTATVQEMFGQLLQQKIQAGVVEQQVSKAVDSLIADAVESVFRSYGDVGKAIKEQLSNALIPNLDEMSDFPRYHDFVMNRVKLAAKDFYDQRLAEALDKELKEIMSEVPERVTLSWILEEFRKAKQSESYMESGGEGYNHTLIIEHDRSFTNVYFDVEENKEKYQCHYRFAISNHRNEFPENEGEIYSAEIDGEETEARKKRKVCFGVTYGFDKILFNIYAMKGRIVMDKGFYADDYDTYFSGNDY